MESASGLLNKHCHLWVMPLSAFIAAGASARQNWHIWEVINALMVRGCLCKKFVTGAICLSLLFPGTPVIKEEEDDGEGDN